MSDPYYTNEDTQDTPATALANIEATKTSLVAMRQHADESLREVEGHLGAVYSDAESRGDEAAKGQIVTAWDRVQQIHNDLALTGAALDGVLAAAKLLSEEHDRKQAALDELEEAIDMRDMDHPLVYDLVQDVEQDFVEWYGDSIYEGALEEAYSESWDAIHKSIHKLFPQVRWQAVHHFTDALDGQRPLNDVQRGLLLSLIQTFDEAEALAS